MQVKMGEMSGESLRDGGSHIEAMYKKYADSLYFFIRERIVNKEWTQDLLHDVFLKAILALKRGVYGEPFDFDSWLYTIAVNACRNFNRRYLREHQSTILLDEPIPFGGGAIFRDVPDYTHNPERVIGESERVDWIIDAIPFVKPRDAIAIYLRFFREGETVGEIARDLEISERTLRRRIRRGLKSLRDFYYGEMKKL
ncbi:MAG: RNA polymerase sigma factor [bacterium]